MINFALLLSRGLGLALLQVG